MHCFGKTLLVNDNEQEGFPWPLPTASRDLGGDGFNFGEVAR